MYQRGFAINAYPHIEEPGTYTIDLFVEHWEDGGLTGVDMIGRSAVEFDSKWVTAIPDEQFGFVLAEVVSQLFASTAPEGMAESIRKDIDREFKAEAIRLNQD
jgi:hypothetical protein